MFTLEIDEWLAALPEWDARHVEGVVGVCPCLFSAYALAAGVVELPHALRHGLVHRAERYARELAEDVTLSRMDDDEDWWEDDEDRLDLPSLRLIAEAYATDQIERELSAAAPRIARLVGVLVLPQLDALTREALADLPEVDQD